MNTEWFNELSEQFVSGQSHAFLLTGNVYDWMRPAMSLERFLALQLSRRIVAVYDPVGGIQFPLGDDQRVEFGRRVGLIPEGDTPPPASTNKAASLLQTIAPAAPTLTLPTEPSEALALLERFMLSVPRKSETRQDKDAVVIIASLEAICPNAPLAQVSPTERTIAVRLQQWGRNLRGFQASGAILIGIVKNPIDLHESVRSVSSRWAQIKIPAPSEAQRLEYIEHLLSQKDAGGEQKYKLADGLTPEAVAKMTAGLGLMNIEDIFMGSLSSEYDEWSLTLEMIREGKGKIILSEYGDYIELKDPQVGFSDIGGKELLKEWFTKNVIAPLRVGNVGRVPRGVLMPGPSGTGKSYFAEALAREAGVNFVVFNPAQILGQYVGNSERNLEKVIEMILSLPPVIVFIDEIDQVLNRGEGGDSGVGKRIFRRILEIMARPDLRGRVVWLAATNRPDLIDAALLSRLEKVAPVLAPDTHERRETIRARLAALSSQGVSVEIALTEGDLESIAALTEGRMGRELDALASKAFEYAQDDAADWRNVTIRYSHLERATMRTKPATQDVATMTRLALSVTNDLDLLPQEYQEKALAIPPLESEGEAGQAESFGRRRKRL